MSIRKVARLGHPVLRKKAKKIPLEHIISEDIQNLLRDMKETMLEYEGIGLAAPQVHESCQMAIINLSSLMENEEEIEAEAENPSKKKPLKKSQKNKKPVEQFTVFINPVIKVLDKTPHGFWEGCLSVPGLRGYVERPRKIQVDFYNEKGKKIKIIAEDFIATVIQHELDHLEGILYIDRMKDLKNLSFIEEADRFHSQCESFCEHD